MECRDPKRLRSFVIELLSDIEKRVEISSSESLEEVIQLMVQELSMKHEATDALVSW